MNTNTSMTGAELRAIRNRLGLTQGELGEALDLHRDHIGRMERGESPITKVTELAVKYLNEQVAGSERALAAFLGSDDFPFAILQATRAGWNGGGLEVECFPDGTYRTLFEMEIGNLYESPGMMTSVPPLNQEEWADIEEMDEAEQVEAIRDYYADEIAAHIRERG